MPKKIEAYIKTLQLDNANPRILTMLPTFFNSLDENKKQLFLGAALITNHNIDKLITSIIENHSLTDFMLDYDKLLVLDYSGVYIVKEGNRRTLALKILTGDFDVEEMFEVVTNSAYGMWISEKQSIKFKKNFLKLKKVMNKHDLEDFLKKQVVEIYLFQNTKEERKKLIETVRLIHVARKEQWDSIESSTFDALAIINSYKVNSDKNLDCIIKEYKNENSLTEQPGKLKKKLIGVMLAEFIKRKYIETAQPHKIQYLYDSYLPVVDVLKMRLSNDLDFEFSILENTELELHISTKEEIFTVPPESIYFELADYILVEKVANTVFKNARSLTGYSNSTDTHLQFMNGLIRKNFKKNVNKINDTASGIIDKYKNSDVEEEYGQSDEQLNQETQAIPSSNVNKTTHGSYIPPYKLIDLKKYDLSFEGFKIEKYIYEIVRQINNLCGTGKHSVVIDKLDEYKWLIGSVLRTPFEYYINVLHKLNFYDSLDVQNHFTSNDIHGAYNKIVRLEEFLRGYYINDNKRITNERIDTFNSFYKRVDSKGKSLNENLQNNYIVNNNIGEKGTPFASNYKSLNACVHGSPQMWSANELDLMCKSLEKYIIICEFLIQSYRKNNNWNFIK